MIIVRSPLRITFGGGGTDLPCYYREHGGVVIAAAIDKYVYVTVVTPFAPGIYLKHSEIEYAATIDGVRHGLIREALRLFEAGQWQIEITTMADVPSGTGLGSSGSFTTALLRALHARRGAAVDPRELAEQASHIEIDLLGEPVGKQDQYIAAFGGLTSFTFSKDGTVVAKPLGIYGAARKALENNILLFFTGYARSASKILKDQVTRLQRQDKALFDDFHYEKENGLRSKEALEQGDLPAYGRLLREHWERKRNRSSGISTPEIDRWYDIGLKNGASGGKLLGAGGGGFLMFSADDQPKLRRAMIAEGLVEVPFQFVDLGAHIVTQ